MITFILITAAIVIVLGGFILHENGYNAGYTVGHDHGFRHANGEHLPPLDGEHEDDDEGLWESCWDLTPAGRDFADTLGTREKGGEP